MQSRILLETSRPEVGRGKGWLLLVAIAEEGNIHKAAKALFMTQPSASKLLKDLETMLEVDLFERLPRGMVPTPYGEMLIRQARIAVNALGIELPGCPLDEKISEMHALRKAGDAIGALAIVTVDNPMCPGTGHRICNDCMKACIYQKQEPVDIPQVETRVLKDVLNLPWGFEIYSLLTRWTPFDLHRPMPKAPTGKKVLVAGMGPAGSPGMKPTIHGRAQVHTLNCGVLSARIAASETSRERT